MTPLVSIARRLKDGEDAGKVMADYGMSLGTLETLRLSDAFQALMVDQGEDEDGD